ncbi:MAG: hypothetical protein J6Y93_01110 [Treponema sp.]|nr:hypothetical protein [Treponema sp.]
MKVRFAVIFAAGLALILAGCSEIQESDNCVLSTEIPEGYGAVQIKLNSQSARTIRPFDLNGVERWNLYFTGSGNSSESFSRDILREMIESPILVKPGKWKVTVSGSDESNWARLSSDEQEVYVTEGNTVYLDDIIIKYSPSYITEQTGTLQYTASIDSSTIGFIKDKDESDDIAVTAVLTPFPADEGTVPLSYTCIVNNTSNSDFTVSLDTEEGKGNISFTATKLEPGYYTLKLTFKYSGLPAVYELLTGDCLYQVAADLTSSNPTDSSTYGYSVTEKFYATNEASQGNGISKNYPDNINAILEKWSENRYLSIHMGDSIIPEIDLDCVKAASRIYIYVYSGLNDDPEINVEIRYDSTKTINVNCIANFISSTPVFKVKNLNGEWNVSSAAAAYILSSSEDGDFTLYTISPN